jgi:hypothetical protein
MPQNLLYPLLKISELLIVVRTKNLTVCIEINKNQLSLYHLIQKDLSKEIKGAIYFQKRYNIKEYLTLKILLIIMFLIII